jgi:hypothetical protein
MQIDQSIWNLRSPRCECCSHQGALCFSTCPGCGHVLLVCDEVGTVYPDFRNLELAVYGGYEDPTCLCPSCGSIAVGRFRNSTATEIQACGFEPNQYE